MTMCRQPLRLLADDLTGALDAAAAFASPSEPVAVCWRGEVPGAGAIALDSRTGDTLYKFNTGGAVAGGVSTYLVDGKQYVAAASGNSSRTIWKTSGAATVVVFGLAGR